jgi:hypothetical protein
MTVLSVILNVTFWGLESVIVFRWRPPEKVPAEERQSLVSETLCFKYKTVQWIMSITVIFIKKKLLIWIILVSPQVPRGFNFILFLSYTKWSLAICCRNVYVETIGSENCINLLKEELCHCAQSKCLSKTFMLMNQIQISCRFMYNFKMRK